MQQQLDLVQEPQGWCWVGNNDAAEAASWFDDFEVDPAPNPIPQVEQVMYFLDPPDKRIFLANSCC